MTKTNKRRRVASVLLALVMLLSLMPSLELPAHAFWDDYDDGFDCPNCNHYHFGSEYMCDCLFCTIDCNYECWVETHCNDCGVCFGDTPYWCETCYKCADCMEDTHCSTCGKCYIGEDDQLCGECHKGSCCSITICDSCGFCDDCANDDSDPMHCSLCNACFGSVDECVDDDDTGVIHCIDCHTACEQCEECLLNQESCEDCGLCLECCRDNSEGGGCPDGETCVESAEWDEHICQGCDGWVTDKEDEDEFCETCEMCKECCEGNSDCSEGMCAMDTDYADHFCEDCGLCFHDSDPCEDGCDQRCKDCCRDAVSAMGCDHDDWCFSDSDFEDHLKTEHAGAGHTHIASATWAADGTQHWHPCRYCDDKKLNAANHEFDAKGVCKVCDYISGSSIVINRQPRGVKCKTSIYSSGDYDEEPENDLLYSEHNWVTFSVSAKSLKGDELTYQWYQKNNVNPTAAPYKLPEKDYYVDVNTPTLRLSVSAEACMDDYSYYCVIGRKGDPSDTMKTAEAKLTATHAYSHKQAGVRVPTEENPIKVHPNIIYSTFCGSRMFLVKDVNLPVLVLAFGTITNHDVLDKLQTSLTGKLLNIDILLDIFNVSVNILFSLFSGFALFFQYSDFLSQHLLLIKILIQHFHAEFFGYSTEELFFIGLTDKRFELCKPFLTLMEFLAVMLALRIGSSLSAFSNGFTECVLVLNGKSCLCSNIVNNNL